jgi:hypothetical protein
MSVKKIVITNMLLSLAALAGLTIMPIELTAPSAVAQGMPGNPNQGMGGNSGQFAQPLPPPPGDGQTPFEVEPGDTNAPPLPPSGMTDPTMGTPHNDRTVVRLYRATDRGQGGERMVQTIRPDQLNADQIQKINGILGINMLNGKRSIEVSATDQQLSEIQNVLAVWPTGWINTPDGRKKIVRDARDPQVYGNQGSSGAIPGSNKGTVSPKDQVNGPIGNPNAFGKTGKENLVDFDITVEPVPTVRMFCRMLVILATVVATVYVAFAAYCMAMGHPNAGGRLAMAIGGLGLLYMCYTIYKVAIINIKHLENPTDYAHNRPATAEVQSQYMQGVDIPGIPRMQPPMLPRPGVPVEPLGNAKNPY